MCKHTKGRQIPWFHTNRRKFHSSTYILILFFSSLQHQRERERGASEMAKATLLSIAVLVAAASCLLPVSKAQSNMSIFSNYFNSIWSGNLVSSNPNGRYGILLWPMQQVLIHHTLIISNVFRFACFETIKNQMHVHIYT